MPKYLIHGVDKESSLDTELTIEAETEGNARVKAELKGVVVTETTRTSYSSVVGGDIQPSGVGSPPTPQKAVNPQPTAGRMIGLICCIILGPIFLLVAWNASRNHDVDGVVVAKKALEVAEQGVVAKKAWEVKVGVAVAKQKKAMEDLATSGNNLAWLYYTLGHYAQAEHLYQHSLEIWEKARGPDHPYVARSLNNLALLYRAMNRDDEAEPLEQRAARIEAIER